MAEFNPDNLKELAKILKEAADLFNAFEKQLDNITETHVKDRTKKSIEEENRKNILLKAIRESALKDYQNQMNSINKKFQEGEISSEEDFIAQQEALYEKYIENTRKRADEATKKLEETYRKRESLESQYQETLKNIDVLEKSLESGALTEKEQLNVQKELNKEKLRQRQLEIDLYNERLDKEQELNNYQKTLLDKLNKERIKQLEEIEKERKRSIEEGIETEEEANRKAKKKSDKVDEEYSEKSKRVSEGNVGKTADTIGRFVDAGLSGGVYDMIDVGGQMLGDIAGTALGNVLGTVFPVFGNLIGNIIGKLLGHIIGETNKMLKEIHKSQLKAADEAATIISKYLGPINTRLQGSEYTLKDFLKTMDENLKASIYINQKNYIENLANLVDKGIAYNVEERSLWMTVGDRIATTFDALDESLTRLIRLQQADLTRSALGSEASITTILNQMFNDTSYLSDMYDSVNSILLESTSQMNIDQATSFTYAVQKWLGALYSVGMSDTTIKTIAEGINFLSTGDVSSLSSNSDLQTLMALAATRSGKSISSLLTTGLFAEDVNDLMKAMVEYLASIADNTSNQVTKSEWANIVNMSVSDLRAFSNLSDTNIAQLYNTVDFGYESSIKEVQNQLSHYYERVTMQEKLDNLLDNYLFSYGMEAAQLNDVDYLKLMAPDYGRRIEENAVSFGMKLLGKALSSWVSDQESRAVGDKVAAELTDDFVNAIQNGIFGLDISKWRGQQYNPRTTRGSEYIGLVPKLTVNNLGLDTNKNYDDEFKYIEASVQNNRNLSSGTVAQDVSYSTSTATTTGSYANTQNFEDTQKQIEEGASDVTSSVDDVSDTIDMLYDALFKDQKTPIKVKIDSGSEEFYNTFEKLVGSNIAGLSDDLSRYMNNSSLYVQNLTNALYTIRGS